MTEEANLSGQAAGESLSAENLALVERVAPLLLAAEIEESTLGRLLDAARAEAAATLERVERERADERKLWNDAERRLIDEKWAKQHYVSQVEALRKALEEIATLSKKELGMLLYRCGQIAEAALASSTPESSANRGWLDIESAPRDGTVFIGCNLDHPSFGSWAMHRRVRHTFTVGGEPCTMDLGGWAIIGDLEPDYDEGHTAGPDPSFSIAQDDLNRSVRYGWMPMPAPTTGGEA